MRNPITVSRTCEIVVQYLIKRVNVKGSGRKDFLISHQPFIFPKYGHIKHMFVFVVVVVRC